MLITLSKTSGGTECLRIQTAVSRGDVNICQKQWDLVCEGRQFQTIQCWIPGNAESLWRLLGRHRCLLKQEHHHTASQSLCQDKMLLLLVIGGLTSSRLFLCRIPTEEPHVIKYPSSTPQKMNKNQTKTKQSSDLLSWNTLVLTSCCISHMPRKWLRTQGTPGWKCKGSFQKQRLQTSWKTNFYFSNFLQLTCK